MKRLALFLLVGSSPALMSVSEAATLVSYQFNGASAAQTTGDLTGSDLTFGAFNNGGAGTKHGISSASDSLFFRTNAPCALGTDGDTLAEAINPNESYATFTLTNNSGSAYSLSTLSFDVFNTNSPADGGTTFFTVYGMSDQAAFTDGNEFGSFTVTASGVSTSQSSPDQAALDLSSMSSLPDGGSVEFRLYMVDDGDGENAIYRIDNITVTGSVIPEPSPQLMLLGGLGLALLFRRRRD